MPGDYQSGPDWGRPDVDDGTNDDGVSGPGGRMSALSGRRGQPWFGRKQFGNGYGPRTWQGGLVTAVLVAFVVITGSLTKGHSPLFFVAIVLAIGVPLAIGAIQRR